MNMIEWFQKTRSRGCPLLAIDTVEPIGTQDTILQWARAKSVSNDETMAWAWDSAMGLIAQTSAAEQYGADEIESPDGVLKYGLTLPSKSILICQFQPEYFNDPVVRQAILNLRNEYKASKRTLVLIGRALELPSSLSSDFLLWRDTLPDTEQLDAIVREIEGTAGIESTTEHIRSAVDALRGMSAFQAEQVSAMALTKQGLDIGQLWQDKIDIIGKVKGLECWQSKEFSPEDVKGLDALISELYQIKNSRNPSRLVIWVDEIEDSAISHQGDLSGVNSDYLGRLATHIVDTGAKCMLLYGQPGVGKSMTAKIAGQILDCLVLAMDFGAMKGSLQGESETNLRYALDIERAIVGNELGSTLYIFTSNNAEALADKLRSRMLTEWFLDLPTEQQGLQIWSVYRAKYNIPSGDPYPSNCEQWTGREIEKCCRLAWERNISLQEASKRIVPIALSQSKAIQDRRNSAIGKFLDPQNGGTFTLPESNTPTKKARKINL